MNGILTRTECAAMRGIAILGIMLHNYCHWLRGTVRENEFVWKPENAERLWNALQEPDALLPLHLLSFFGHYGVPVFLFLSGFGLVMKYEDGRPVPTGRFVRYNFLKLFRMFIIGFVVFTMLDAITPGTHRYHLTDVLAMMGMVANVLPDPSQTVWPGPYWYFGLTLQLYIVYRLLLFRWRHWGVVAVMVLGCWLLQVAAADSQELLERLRYNFIGGMLPFAIGVVLGRLQRKVKRSDRPLTAPFIAIASVVLTFVMSYCFHSWLWIPAVIVAGTISLVKVLPVSLLNRLVWMGGLSAAIFVSHPIVRKIFIRHYCREDVYAGCLLYLVASIGVAWLFVLIFNKIPKPNEKIPKPNEKNPCF